MANYFYTGSRPSNNNTHNYTGSEFTGFNGVGTADTSTLTMTIPAGTGATTWNTMPNLTVGTGYPSPFMIDVRARLASAVHDTNSFFPMAMRDSSNPPNIILFVQAEGTGTMTIYDQSGLKSLSPAVFSFTGNEWIRFIIADDGGTIVYYGTGAVGSQTWTLKWAGQILIPASPENYTNIVFNQYQGVAPATDVSIQWADVQSTLLE